MNHRILLPLLAALLLLPQAVSAQTTAFTYQGRLTDNNFAANGNYDVRFTLYSAVTGGSVVGTAVTVNPLVVTSGLFTASLDFGSNFPGNDRWMEIAVRPAGSPAAYTPLTPRQKITSAPYATRAASAGTSAALTGNITAGQVSGGTLSTALFPASIARLDLTANFTQAINLNTTHQAPLALASSAIGGTWMNLGNSSDAAATTWNLISTGSANGEGAGKLLFRDADAGAVRFTISTDGSVGIGTTTPEHRLDVDGNLGVRGTLMVDSHNQNDGTDIPGIIFGDYNSFEVISSQRGTTGPNRYGLDFYTGNARRVSITNSGTVDIGTPTSNGSLTVHGATAVGTATQAASLAVHTGVGQVQIRNDSGLVPVIEATGGGLPGIMRLRNSLEVWPNAAGTAGGYVDVRAMNGGSTITLDGESGQATVKTLNITGGSDLAEPFALADTSLEPGTVVVIDDDSPGQLRESTNAYDKCVAGIISGAGGINPGISLHQEGVNSGGRNVALTGRVYVRADATAGPIAPGDLLTTSPRAGYAMTARDTDKRQGAVLGKAMSRLDQGTGLVLVLVTLQ